MKYAYRGHAFRTDTVVARVAGRPVCGECGLMRLKNLLTDWCAARGCRYDEAPGYEEALRELPARHREAVG